MLNFIQTEFFYYFLVAARLLPILLFVPGFGESFVLPQLRIAMLVLLTIIITPILQKNLPPLPEHFLQVVMFLGGEILIGLFLALLTRLFIYVFEIAGSVISQSIGFANVFITSPLAAQQASIISSFLSLIGLLIIFSLSFHHLFIKGTIVSYDIFKPGSLPGLDDFSKVFVENVNLTFNFAISFSAPFLAISLVFYFGMGLISRLVTQIQVFFIALPLQVLLGLVVLYIGLVSLFTWYKDKMFFSFMQIWGG